jgi:hypothetical protein
VIRVRELRRGGLVYITQLEVRNEKWTDVRETAEKHHPWTLGVDGRIIVNKT